MKKAGIILVCSLVVGFIAYYLAVKYYRKPAAPAPETVPETPTVTPIAPVETPVPIVVTSPTVTPIPAPAPPVVVAPAPAPVPTPTPTPAPPPVVVTPPPTVTYLTPTLVRIGTQAFIKGIPAPYDNYPVIDVYSSGWQPPNPAYNDYYFRYNPSSYPGYIIAERFSGSDALYTMGYGAGASPANTWLLNRTLALLYGSL